MMIDGLRAVSDLERLEVVIGGWYVLYVHIYFSPVLGLRLGYYCDKCLLTAMASPLNVYMMIACAR